MPSISFDDFMREELAEPRVAAEYLKAAADFDDQDRFGEAFQVVARLNPTFAYEMVQQIALRYTVGGASAVTEATSMIPKFLL